MNDIFMVNYRTLATLFNGVARRYTIDSTPCHNLAAAEQLIADCYDVNGWVNDDSMYTGSGQWCIPLGTDETGQPQWLEVIKVSVR